MLHDLGFSRKSERGAGKIYSSPLGFNFVNFTRRDHCQDPIATPAVRVFASKLSVTLGRLQRRMCLLTPSSHTNCLILSPPRRTWCHSQGARWRVFVADSTRRVSLLGVWSLIRPLVSRSPGLPRKSSSPRPGLTESHPSSLLPPCDPCFSSDQLKPTFRKNSARLKLLGLSTVAPWTARGASNVKALVSLLDQVYLATAGELPIRQAASGFVGPRSPSTATGIRIHWGLLQK